jgi:hypothetical protein
MKSVRLHRTGNLQIYEKPAPVAEMGGKLVERELSLAPKNKFEIMTSDHGR